MKLIIPKTKLQLNPELFLRRAGYGFIHDRRSGHDSFVRRLGSHFYPRLHMYVNQDGQNYIFNLHLDQKQPSYKGVHAHNAEYDGEVVSAEINRLKGFVSSFDNLDTTDPLDSLGSGEYDKNIQKEEKKSFWKRLFS